MEKYRIDTLTLIDKLKQLQKIIEKTDNKNTCLHTYMYLQAEFGELVATAKDLYDIEGYPKVVKDGIVTKRLNRTNLVTNIPELKNADKLLSNIDNKIGIESFKRENYVGEKEVYKLLSEVIISSRIGEYKIPKDNKIAGLKKIILANSTNVIPCNIEENMKINPNYLNECKNSYDNLLKMYEIYKDSVGIEICTIDKEKHEFNGPQFGKEITDIFEILNNNYYKDRQKIKTK